MKSVVLKERRENLLDLQIRNNNIKPSLINSLRRIILGEIPTYALEISPPFLSSSSWITQNKQLRAFTV